MITSKRTADQPTTLVL